MSPKGEPPIQNIESVDIVGQRRDGGVDLVIVASGRLDGTAETQRLVLEKIESYLQQLNSEEFRREFAYAGAERTVIVLACAEEPDPVIRELVRRAEAWVAENHARLELRVGAVE